MNESTDNCLNCGNKVKRPGNKYCCRKCWMEHKNKLLKKIKCKFCESEFAIFPSQHKRNFNFCNINCRSNYFQKLAGVGFKTCSRCSLEKPVSDFSTLNKNTNIRRSYCKVCSREIDLIRSHTAYDRWRRSKTKAINKHGSLWWNLPEDYYASLIVQACHYCGDKLGISGVGLDRKDNSLGYVIENVVPCCKRCNVVKGNYFTYQEMMKLSPILQEIRVNRLV